ncbi:MAG TPA: FtsX-like permease family protein [Stellaceae bacterium]|nr:FtsX-like permease family protein [Stellaceae bacterium]
MRGFRVFLACLVLGVGAIAAIGSLRAAVEAGLRADARLLLGGDVSARLTLRPAGAAERDFLASSGTLSETASLRAMARSLDGKRRSLIELRAVDAAYPLYGTVSLGPAGPLATALAQDGGAFGAVMEAAAATRLGLRPGEEFRIGDAVFRLSALIERLPDAAVSGLSFGPRVIIARQALAETGLLRPGALVNYEYRIRLPPERNTAGDAASWIEQARAAFPQAGWRLRGSAEASPSLERLLDRLGFFLSLAGVTALLVGGVGIGNAVAGYIASKTEAIATLKCLGASTGLVFTAYLLQILALALIGIAIGLTLGSAAPALAGPLLAGLLPVSLPFQAYWAPLGFAAVCGLLATLVFALWPLAAIGRVPPGALWRDVVSPAPRRLAPLAAAATAIAAVALAAAIVLSAPERRFAMWYIGGALAAFALFRLAAWLVTAAARRAPIPSHPLLRLALANLHRPGGAAARIVVSLGIGLSVMIVVALVQGNLAVEIGERLADSAPADFYVDIQPGQLAEFERIVASVPGARSEQVPMLRGRITQLGGTPVEQAEVAQNAEWALRNERGLTYAAVPPKGSRIVAGEWWPSDYRGPPLISFDSELARGMGLRVGDTLTVNLLGREITGQIANLRRIEWTRLGINFAIVFAPGILEAAPQTHLAAVYAPPSDAEHIAAEVTERFPNVTAIPVREALAAVAGVVERIGDAVSAIASVTLAAGVLVLGGALAAGHRRRVYDSVLLKVLGATRGFVAGVFLVEHLLLGFVTAGIASVIGTLAAWALVTGPMNAGWTFLPWPLLLTASGAVGLTIVLGLTGTWRALGAKPAPYLRGE